jgi:lysophospholipase L1-like esterase
MPRKRHPWVLLIAPLVALLTMVTLGIAIRPARAAAEPIRIMPLGDSITAAPGCWRAMLWDQLQAAGHTGIDFVGSVSDGGSCGSTNSYDQDHEGHSGYLATGIADNNHLPPWLDAAKPDVVLMHLGTNDSWGSSIPLETKLAAFTTLVDQMRDSNPDMKILLAQILPMNPSGCDACGAEVVELNNALPDWAADLTTSRSPIILVDQWTGFDTATDTIDGVHPNDTGFQKMADRWYPALAQVLDGVTPPLPTTSPTTNTASPTTTSAPAGAGTCTASYSVVSHWPGGFLGQVTVRNDDVSASTAWRVSFTFADGQQVNQSWNTVLTQDGATVTADNASYNGVLPPGATTSFGFLATSNTPNNTVPTPTCTPS